MSLPFSIPANKVPRMPNEDNAHTREINTVSPPKKRGRPKGHTLSRETRLKISDTRAAQEKHKKATRKAAPLRSTFPTLSLEMRRAITERDERTCRSCGEGDPDLRVHSFLNGLDDLGALERDPELHAVMCSFCRRIADGIEARNIASMLRTRW